MKKICSTKCICWNTLQRLKNYGNKKCYKRCGIDKKKSALNCIQSALLSTIYDIK